MSVVKVIEVLSQSEKSWEDATQKAVTVAAKSVRNIKSIYIENMQATVEDNKIVAYRVDAKISFLVE
jgi:flavin-binding protein dodecin